MKQTRMWFWLPCSSGGLPGLTSAAPDYVTAWPRQVAVDKPDPVLGNKPFGEHWAYGETFARRFRDFPLEKVDPELKGGHKENIWR